MLKLKNKVKIFKLNNTKVYVSSKLKPLFFLCLLLTGGSVFAQDPFEQGEQNQQVQTEEEYVVDTNKIVRPEFIDPNLHSPRKATIYSAVLPGLGQMYNKKYWKLPIVYGGLGTLGYFIYNSRKEYHLYRDAYDFVKSGSTGKPVNTYAETFSNDEQTLQSRRNQYRTEMEKYSIYLAIFYIAQVLDATVDAHLMDYDVSDDLSLSLQPSVMPVSAMGSSPQIAGGVSLKLKFK